MSPWLAAFIRSSRDCGLSKTRSAARIRIMLRGSGVFQLLAIYEGANKCRVSEDPPSPSGRGQGEGHRICIDLRPSPGASRHPLPVGEGHAHSSFKPSISAEYLETARLSALTER